MSVTINGRQVDPEAITVTQLDDGSVRIDTAPLPEYISVASSLWDEALVDPDAGDSHWLWVETIGHADDDVDNDGHILHLDATNVTATYRLLIEQADGSKVLQLEGWAER